MSGLNGARAEKLAANFLAEHEFKIRARNWRNRWCEIDIVAEKDARIHFVEVKYRQNSRFGAGYEYVTPAKLKQLKRAALHWISDNDWRGDYCIDVASVDGAGSVDYIEDVVLD